jgi:hypothetical protein
MTTRDTSHLNALELGLSHERDRLAKAKTESERTMRAVWVAQREKEIAQEKAFLGIADETLPDLSDDELLAALTKEND